MELRIFFYHYDINSITDEIWSTFNRFPSFVQDRAAKYYNPKDRWLYLMGKNLVVKHVLDGEFSKLSTISYNHYNKPYLEDGCAFNISHSENIVILATSPEGDIGVDIEFVREFDFHKFRSRMSAQEYHTLCKSGDKNYSFFKHWTAKEAILKCYGVGLTVPLNSFEVTSDVVDLDGFKFYCQQLALHPSYVCHVATKSNFEGLPVKIIKETNSLFYS